MPPFSTYAILATYDLSVYNYAGSNTRTHNNTDNHAGIRIFFLDDPEFVFRHGKAIGIIGYPDRDTQSFLKIFLEFMSVQIYRIAIS